MLRVLSTFSGVSSASVAWKPLGFEFVGYSEIDPFACHVLSARLGATKPRHTPDTVDEKAQRNLEKLYRGLPESGIPNLGDITKITDDDLRALGRVDLLEGGTPCQSMSVAGPRMGLKDYRGTLLLRFCELAERMHKINGTRFVVWENVKGALSDETNAFGHLLGSLSGSDKPLEWPTGKWPHSGRVYGLHGRTISWHLVDTQDFGIPQRRQRVFLFADLSDGRRAGETWPAVDLPVVVRSESGAAKKRSKARKDYVSRIGSLPIGLNDNYHVYHPPVFGTLMASGAGVSRPAGFGSELDFVVVQKHKGEFIARRLLPIECERLQAFPDGWTDVIFKGKPALDKDRYRTLGNTMTTRCMRAIGVGILEHYADLILDEITSEAFSLQKVA